MAVTNLKIQMEFSIQQNGWSEFLYHAGASPVGFKASAALLVSERLKCLVQGARCHHVRISGATPGQRSYRFPPSFQSGSIPSAPDVPAVTSTIGLYTAEGSFRKLLLHGLPDAAHVYTVSGQPELGLGSLTRAYLQFLVANGYQIRTKTLPANDPALKTITNITVAANSVVTFTVDATGYSTGNKVIVSGCKGANAGQFNGVWTIVSVANDLSSFTATTTRRITTTFIYNGGTGKIRNGGSSGYAFQNITDFDEIWESSTRKVGRPSNSPRGRR
jgi:hypothetical protein